MLLRDPRSWLFAAVNGWEYPMSREDSTLRDIGDVLLLVNSKRTPKPWPRPYKNNTRTKRIGKTNLKPLQARAVLEAASPIPRHYKNG